MSTPIESDSRVLEPAEDEPMVTVKSAFGGSGEAYHTENCINVQRMRESRDVKLSIAEWKGYHECENCIALRESTDNPEPDPEPDLTDDCKQLRRQISNGMTREKAAENSPWADRSAYRHATGACSHEHDVPPVARGWYFDSSLPDTPRKAPQTTDKISAEDCTHIRELLVSGETLKSVGKKFDLRNDGVRYHATGECGHDIEIDAVSHGWHSK